MLVEICLVMRISMNITNMLYSLRTIEATPCIAMKDAVSRDPHAKTIKVDKAVEYWTPLSTQEREQREKPFPNISFTPISDPKDDSKNSRVSRMKPNTIMRMSKIPKFGFQPHFDQGYLEPFEPRPKPITVVTFRKNGHLKSLLRKGNETVVNAELQSHYNNVSSFWENSRPES